MERKRFEEIRQRYEESTNDADELAEAALEELKEGSKGDDDAAAVAIAYAVLALSRRVEIASDVLLEVLEASASG